MLCLAEPCNTHPCPARDKWCPGTRVSRNATDSLDTLSECSGRGVCHRDLDPCTEEDGGVCVAVCVCDGEWRGSDCSMTPAQLATAQALRAQFFDVLVRGLSVSCVFRGCRCASHLAKGGVGGHADTQADVWVLRIRTHMI